LDSELLFVGRPLAYFITFTCYGSHLHGAEEGSVDRNHNHVGNRYVSPDARRRRDAHARMAEAPYLLDRTGRRAVLTAIHQVCTHRAWTLFAAHVRVNHVHVVVHADVSPEAVMHDFKAYASRLLRKRDTTRARTWTRHGSTRYLWNTEDVDAAVRYTVEGQGEEMAVFSNTAP
jgi:REP element-mobilizing transposase RayT